MKRRVNPEMIDDDNPEWTDEDFKRAKKFSELPKSLQTTLRNVRGPQKSPTKERITIRLSRDVVDKFRSSGDGWQGRMDSALRQWLKRHNPEAMK